MALLDEIRRAKSPEPGRCSIRSTSPTGCERPGSTPDPICPAIVGNIIVYKDWHHLSATYVRSLTDELERQMAWPSLGGALGRMSHAGVRCWSR